MNKQLSNNDIDLKLTERNIIRVGDYINAKTKIEFQCLICKYIWTALARQVCNKKTGCPQCSGKLTLSNDDIDQKLEKTDIVRTGPYINSKTKMTVRCLICNHYWNALPSNIYVNGHGCPKCSKNAKLTCKEIDNALHIREIKRLGDYINSQTGLDLQCLSCNFVWNTHIGNVLRKNTGCPRCQCGHKISKPETEWLNILGVPQEYRNIKLKIGSKMIMPDGFIPHTNTIYEFYGDYWHGNPKKFIPTDMHPLIKKTYGDLFRDTMEREQLIKSAGYNLITIWESDFKKEYTNVPV